MANDYTTFWVGESFTKTFRAINVDLTQFTDPIGSWRFKFFNGIANPDRYDKDSASVKKVPNTNDVDIVFEIDNDTFIPDWVGSIQYQIELKDKGDSVPRYFTGIYVGEIKLPIHYETT